MTSVIGHELESRRPSQAVDFAHQYAVTHSSKWNALWPNQNRADDLDDVKLKYYSYNLRTNQSS